MENLTKINLTPFFTHEEKDYNFKVNQEPCIICQRPVTISDRTKFVHMLTTLEIVNVGYHEESQGLFPIGNECCKKFPKQFLFS